MKTLFVKEEINEKKLKVSLIDLGKHLFAIYVTSNIPYKEIK